MDNDSLDSDTMSETIRIILVDDQKIFAEGLKYVLESRASDIEVVGIGLNGREAVELAVRENPDIILMDVRMPEMDGVHATAEIKKRDLDAKIVMFTTFDDDEYVEAALRNGAIGYLLKNRPPMELIYSLRALQKGIMQLDPTVAEHLFNKDLRPATHSEEEVARQIDSLTRREKEVLHLLAQAFDNKQIAHRMNVAEQTARNYIHAIYSKLGISNRAEIVRILSKIGF